jgi:hypothetical protein
LNSILRFIEEPIFIFLPSIIKNITLCKQIINRAQGLVEEKAVTMGSQDLKRSFNDQDALGNRDGAEQHGAESFLCTQVGISPVEDRLHLKTPEQVSRHVGGLTDRQIFVVLLDQGDIDPDIQVRDERDVDGNPA